MHRYKGKPESSGEIRRCLQYFFVVILYAGHLAIQTPNSTKCKSIAIIEKEMSSSYSVP